MSLEKNLSVDFALSACTPNVRRTDASKFSRRSVSTRLLTSDYEVSQSPSLSRISFQTPSKRLQTPLKEVQIEERSLFQEEDSFQVCDELFKTFQDLYVSYPSKHQCFDLLLGYENACSTLLGTVDELAVQFGTESNKNLENLSTLLVLERNTWRLVRTIFQDKLNTDFNDENQDDILMELAACKCSEKEVAENLFQRDVITRRGQLIVDWIERNLAEDFDSSALSKIEYFSNSHVAWENTLHDLKGRTNQKTARAFVTEMDPDAPHRQKRKLHDLDVDDETLLMRYLFAYIMAGNLEEAEKVAERQGYLWLAAAMEGWRLYHDPNNNTAPSDGDVLQPDLGNPFRHIWRAACWKTIEQEAVSIYERAIMSALSGHLTGLLAVCSSWQDKLWAYTKILVDSRVNAEIDMLMNKDKSKMPSLPSFKSPTTLEEIFKEIEVSTNCKDPSQLTVFQAIQKFLILDQLEDLFSVVRVTVSSFSPDLVFHLLRFVSHLFLFLRLVGWVGSMETCHELTELFIEQLISHKQPSLVATYVATLPLQSQVNIYAKFLQPIVEPKLQLQCLEWAREAGLDVHQITLTTVKMICWSSEPEPSEVLNNRDRETTPGDQQQIDSLDWLLFDHRQRTEAAEEANRICRSFVASGKIEAGEAALAKLPSDTILLISQANRRERAEESNTIREILCFQAYFQALKSFNDWFYHVHDTKPKKVEEPSKGNKTQSLKFTDWVAYEHKVKLYEEEMERWQQALEIQTQNTVDKLYNVLLFPDGGWMVDQKDGSTEERTRKMALLRQLCIPQVCTLLQRVFCDTGRHKEAVQLADLVADNKHSLFMEFSKVELKDFLMKCRESSLALLDQNLDPFGYSFE